MTPLQKPLKGSTEGSFIDHVWQVCRYKRMLNQAPISSIINLVPTLIPSIYPWRS